MDLPDTLPARLYLLTYRPERGRFPYSGELGLALRAAALTDLLHRGLLVDEEGHARPGAPAPARLDPLLAGVLDRIALSRPRRWEYWVRSGDRAMPRAVRLALAERGTIELEEHRILGLFPTLRPVLPDPRLYTRLAEAVTRALEDPLAKVEPWQGALVALAHAGRLPGGRERRAHRDRVKALTASAEPVATALRRAVSARQAAHTAAG